MHLPRLQSLRSKNGTHTLGDRADISLRRQRTWKLTSARTAHNSATSPSATPPPPPLSFKSTKLFGPRWKCALAGTHSPITYPSIHPLHCSQPWRLQPSVLISGLFPFSEEPADEGERERERGKGGQNRDEKAARGKAYPLLLPAITHDLETCLSPFSSWGDFFRKKKMEREK